MPVDALSGVVGAPSAAAATSTTTSAPKQEMDSELFMKLLITQLRNQDPSSPMDTNEMITQTTQLATMEKLSSMADTSTEGFSLQMRTAAAAFVGTNVSYLDAAGATVTGIATSVSFIDGVPTVTVGKATVPLDQISGISATAPASPEVPAVPAS